MMPPGGTGSMRIRVRVREGEGGAEWGRVSKDQGDGDHLHMIQLMDILYTGRI